MRYLLLYLLLFFEVRVIRTLGLAEFGLSLLIFKKIIDKNPESQLSSVVHFDQTTKYAVAFVLFSLSTIFFNPLYSVFSGFTNFMRLSLMVMAFIVLPNKKYPYHEWLGYLKHTKYVLIILLILSLSEFFLIRFGVIPDFRLLKTEDWINNRGRPHGVYSEPSLLAITISILAYFLINYNIRFISKRDHYSTTLVILFSIICLILTTSLIGIVLGSFLLVLWIHKLGDIKWKIILSSVFILGIFFFSKTTLFQAYSERLTNIFDGSDNSTQHRMIGSSLYVIESLEDNWFNGIGIGQSLRFSEINRIDPDGFSQLNRTVNHSFGSISLELGLGGLFIFIILSFSVFKKNLSGFILMMLIMASHGAYIFYFFWLHLILQKIFKAEIVVENSPEFDISSDS